MRRLALVSLWIAASAAAGASLPAGFTETILTSSLADPTAMTLAPDGRIFVCEQSGTLRVIKNGALLPTPFLTLTVDDLGERGLLGVVLDPNFPTNQHVYAYYTVPGSPPHNRLSRFTANGDVAVAGSEVILLELNNLNADNHNGGALHFGPDGKLYIASGNNASNPNSQNLGNLLGKILRLNSDGTIPTDNPFYNTPGARKEIWTYGLRNPFTFGIQPGTGLMYFDDVGEGSWEEINVGVKGANYGWSLCEGPCTPHNPLYADPFYWYNHAGGQCAITAGDFYDPQVPQFPSAYVGKYFFADFCAGWIKYIDPAATGNPPPVTSFATGLISPVDIVGGYDGFLYYLMRGAGSTTGVVSKVSYTGGSAPVITQDPVSQLISTGHPVTFDVAASGASLTYQWQRNDMDISGANSTSYTIASVSLTDNLAKFRCKVSNGSGTATSAEAILTVTSNQPPVATIDTPPPPNSYNAGDTIAYSGSGFDPETGVLPPSKLTWWVNFHHNTHFHPFIPPTSGATSGSFVIPVLGETSPNVWYRIHLSVVDPVGLTNETYVDVIPNLSTMTLATNPAGLQLTLDGQPIVAPQSVTGVVNMTRTLGAPSPQSGHNFVSWSDGGAQTHDISWPPANTPYTALFTGGGPTPTPTFTPTRTRTPTASMTPTATRTPTVTPTPSVTPTRTATATATRTSTRTATATATRTPTRTATATATTSATATKTPTHTFTPLPATNTPTRTSTLTPTRTSTATATRTATRTFTLTPTNTPTSTATRTATRTATATATPTRTSTSTATATPVPSAPIVSSIGPSSGPASGAVASMIVGAHFFNGATVKIGGTSATGVSVMDNAHIAATVPGRTPGTLNDVTVTDPSLLTGTLPKGWFADFLDVPQANLFHDDVERIFRAAITAGCGDGTNYCVGAIATRAQMAVFLLKSEHGSTYVPPGCAGNAISFADVPCPSLYADWIEQLSAEGITAGCGGASYCPDASVSRQQMAVFLLKTEHGSAYVPPSCAGNAISFLDVPCPSQYANWIEQLAAENVTAGCGGGDYCPASPVLRGPMATFLARTFGLSPVPVLAPGPPPARLLRPRD